MMNRRRLLVVYAIIVGGLALTPSLIRDTIPPAPVTGLSHDAAPQFAVDWLRGELRLTGATASRQHEQTLLKTANDAFPNSPVSTDFRPLGVVPDYWLDATVNAVATLTGTLSARAELRTGHLSIRGVASDDLAWHDAVRKLQQLLPKDVTIELDSITVDTRQSPEAACAGAFNGLHVGPINFEESTSNLRDSAHPRLQRVIAMAIACRSAIVSITGHTDASGNAHSNLKLSTARAMAVADYLVQGGVDRTRLHPVGVGSDQPVATNRTRYGRSLNRRIEITFEPTDPVQ